MEFRIYILECKMDTFNFVLKSNTFQKSSEEVYILIISLK